MVRPIKFWLTPNDTAIWLALFTTRLPPKITATSPPAIKIRDLYKGMLFSSGQLLLVFKAEKIIFTMQKIIPERSRIPSSLLSLPSAIITQRIAVIRILTGISRFRISRFVLKPAINAQIPTTISPLKILEPIILLTAISLLPASAALMLTEASGALVPMATIVRPMMTLGILRNLASEELPSTKKSAHLINNTKPIISNRYSI